MHIVIMLIATPFVGKLITNPPTMEPQAWLILVLLGIGVLFYTVSR